MKGKVDPMHETEPTDRRRHERVPLVRRGKLRAPGWVRFAPFDTANISISGVLLSVDAALPLKAGDHIELAIAFDDEPILVSEHAVRAIVRRVTPINHATQAIGIEFGEEGALPHLPIVTRPTHPAHSSDTSDTHHRVAA